jgi:Helix-turn-helix domain
MNTTVTNQPPLSSRVSRTSNQGALKLKDACRYLGNISPSSLRRLIDRGLLKPNRALRHILISVAELDRFLEEGQQ